MAINARMYGFEPIMNQIRPWVKLGIALVIEIEIERMKLDTESL